MDELTNQHPVLSMIKNMTATKKSDRLDIEDLVKSIDNAKKSGLPIINSELFRKIEIVIDEDMNYLESKKQMNEFFDDLANFRNLTFGLITAATQMEDQVLRNSILHSKVSRHIHEQGKTLFCWAFAISSMLRQSLIMALENFTDCDPLKVDAALTKLKQNEFHKKLRNELIMLPIPKLNKAKQRLENGINDKDVHYLERAVERVSFCMLRREFIL